VHGSCKGRASTPLLGPLQSFTVGDNSDHSCVLGAFAASSVVAISKTLRTAGLEVLVTAAADTDRALGGSV